MGWQKNLESMSAVLWIAGLVLILTATEVSSEPSGPAVSKSLYRLPYADGVKVKIFDDFNSHRPIGRIDFFGVEGARPFRIVAAAAGKVMAIQDGFAEQLSGRAAKDCHNNYIWIAHGNGEWSGYSHIRQGTSTGAAKLHVGDRVEAGQLLGYEGAVGCAMLEHLHFEVASPAVGQAIDENGFLLDNDAGKRERLPRFCTVPDRVVKKDQVYTTAPCH
jgi:murein DD-endopeptidase MepM/ murein hydrolase activator NlpD